jgi:hypothetical protein
MPIIYRTAGPWGAGKGANLVAGEVDGNFHDLDGRVGAVEDNIPAAAVGIAFFSVTPPNLFYVHMTNGTIQGPFALPQLAWNFRGEWTPSTVYSVNDVITANGSTYMVLINHTSASLFDPNANDGAGHNAYGLLLSNAGNSLPQGGLIGQYLVKSDTPDYAVSWQTPAIFPAQNILEAPDATYTLTLSNIASYVRCVNASGCAVTIPADSTLTFPLSTEISFRQCTASGIVLTADTGVQFNLIAGYSARTGTAGAVITAKKVDVNNWDIFGLLAV